MGGQAGQQADGLVESGEPCAPITPTGTVPGGPPACPASSLLLPVPLPPSPPQHLIDTHCTEMAAVAPASASSQVPAAGGVSRVMQQTPLLPACLPASRCSTPRCSTTSRRLIRGPCQSLQACQRRRILLPLHTKAYLLARSPGPPGGAAAVVSPSGQRARGALEPEKACLFCGAPVTVD